MSDSGGVERAVIMAVVRLCVSDWELRLKWERGGGSLSAVAPFFRCLGDLYFGCKLW